MSRPKLTNLSSSFDLNMLATRRKQESAQLKALQQIPGVGPSIAKDLLQIGIRSIADLKGKNPAELYEKSNRKRGAVQDRCLLYVFRCAVYFATTKKLSPEKLKWWYWKDKTFYE